jgi:hypothetical protein
MATFNAIAAVSNAILNVLKTSQPPAELGASLTYPLYSAKNFEGDGLPAGFSLFLWRVTLSSTQRNLPPRRLPDGRVMRPSLPLDLHYLLTPWAGDIETQQRMLGWAMRVLEDVTTLPAAMLNYHLAETDTFSSDESVELVADPMAMTDLFNLWDKLKHNMQTSMTYLVRNVLIDSQQQLQEYPLVQGREFNSVGAAV